MSKQNYFGKSFVPALIMLILMLAATGLSLFLPTLTNLLGRFLDSTIMSVLSDPDRLSVYANFIYGCAGVLIFSIWYNKVFVIPFRDHPRRQPNGYSFHTFVAFLFIAVGLQYLSSLMTRVCTSLLPEVLTSLQEVMKQLGTGDITILVFLYTVILAPILEELVFRGLVFRYTRHAMPFWFANLWQAFLFGLLHLNLLQGICGFLIGLVLGWMAKRGRGIRYTIPVHILFNLFGLYCAGFADFTQSFAQYPVLILGLALLAFGLWIFYTDFYTDPVSEED